MNVTIIGPSGARITTDLAVQSIKWGCAATQTFGEATLFVPQNSVAYDSDYIDDENAECFVQIEHPTLGFWAGFCCKIADSDAGCYVYAKDLMKWLDGRLVNEYSTFEGMPAGLIWRQAVGQALYSSAFRTLNHGSYGEYAPAVQRYPFVGQSVARVAADLQALTGHEPSIDYETLTVSWITPASDLLTFHYCGDVHIAGASREVDSENRITEIRVVGPYGNDNAIDYYCNANGFWNRQERIESGEINASALAQAAEAYLATRDHPVTTYRGSVRENAATVTQYSGGVITLPVGTALWDSLREGTIIQALMPGAGIGGSCPTLRVIGRAWTDGSPLLQTEFQYLQPLTLNGALRVSTKRAASQTMPVHTLPHNDPLRMLIAAGRQEPGTFDAKRLIGVLQPGVIQQIGEASGSVAFFGGNPTARPGAITQTYATTSQTMNAYTPDAESSAYTGIDNAQGGTVYATVADVNALRVAYENLRAALENRQNVLNFLIDSMQSVNIAG